MERFRSDPMRLRWDERLEIGERGEREQGDMWEWADDGRLSVGGEGEGEVGITSFDG